MMQLSEELTSTENKVAFARQAYNDAVMSYNNAREVFPSSIVAGMFNFSTGECAGYREAGGARSPQGQLYLTSCNARAGRTWISMHGRQRRAVQTRWLVVGFVLSLLAVALALDLVLFTFLASARANRPVIAPLEFAALNPGVAIFPL